MQDKPGSPEVGWAVQESPEVQERRSRRRARSLQRNTPKVLLLSVLTFWNAAGIGLMLYVAYGGTNELAGTRDVVFNVIFWSWLVGDVVLGTVGWLSLRAVRRRRSA